MTAYVDGSFASSKQDPSDFDGCWDRKGVDLAKLKAADPVLLDFSNKRAAQKAKYLGEFFPADASADSTSRLFLDFFRTDRDGNEKGILKIDLENLHD